jgi:hypothetical protein
MYDLRMPKREIELWDSMPKPSYKLARDARSTASMEIEPSTPGTTVTDQTKTAHSEVLAPPDKPGAPKATISPSPKAGPGWKAEPTPAHPEDWKRPDYSDTVKT